MNGKKPVVLGFNNYHNKYVNSPDLDIYTWETLSVYVYMCSSE